MNVPEELFYTSDHEWVRPSESAVRVGITDFAQDSLGDIVFVELPTVGAAVTKGGALSEVESTKSVSEVYAPVSGKVVACNEQLRSAPELLNSDPYGDGWICTIEASDPAELKALLGPEEYRAVIDGQ
ncbi:MAG: glycine cleavage system protein GcvH [Actinomycetota bacterium]|jgi:glycine cleavage system H protein|nr:glycine cleavage system protein GcvH [Actinomycetota bacterium]